MRKFDSGNGCGNHPSSKWTFMPKTAFVDGDGAGHAAPQGLAGGDPDHPAPLVFGRRRPNLKPGPAGKRALCLDLSTSGRVDPWCGPPQAMVK